MEQQKVKNIIESVLLAADKPLDVKTIETLFETDMDRPGHDQIMQALQSLSEDYRNRGIRLHEVASGYRMQVVEENAPWVARLWEEKPQRYSRALLETLVLIAYRQPITRGEIEEIRGVSVSTQTTKTLLERDWVRVLGHKDVPGRPAMYGTTRAFLDYFNLKTLDELPALSEIKDMDKLYPELALESHLAEELPAPEMASDTVDPVLGHSMMTGSDEQTADAASGADSLESGPELINI
ncbi:MAG: segregation and condensation protein [Pseudomonadota bacterium]|nr:segregation and condensation protein [Pseudomonadota bacterium]